jgi:hypothetical protein
VTTVYVVVTLLTVAANLGVAVVDVAWPAWPARNAAEVGVPASWLPWLAAAKAAGGVGLLVGFWLPLLGIAAAVGLVLFFVGAVTAHVMAKVFHNIAFPLTYLALAVGTLVLRASLS